MLRSDNDLCWCWNARVIFCFLSSVACWHVITSLEEERSALSARTDDHQNVRKCVSPRDTNTRTQRERMMNNAISLSNLLVHSQRMNNGVFSKLLPMHKDYCLVRFFARLWANMKKIFWSFTLIKRKWEVIILTPLPEGESLENPTNYLCLAPNWSKNKTHQRSESEREEQRTTKFARYVTPMCTCRRFFHLDHWLARHIRCIRFVSSCIDVNHRSSRCLDLLSLSIECLLLSSATDEDNSSARSTKSLLFR